MNKASGEGAEGAVWRESGEGAEGAVWRERGAVDIGSGVASFLAGGVRRRHRWRWPVAPWKDGGSSHERA